MSDASTEQGVECPICGEEFDPSAAGGWCTNPDCGEWQHTDDSGAVEASEADSGASAESTREEPDRDLLSETEARTDDSDSVADAESTTESATDDAGETVEENGADENTETAETDSVAEAAEAGAPANAADAESAPDSPGAPAGDESTEPDAEAATSDAPAETPETATEAGADETTAGESASEEPASEDPTGTDETSSEESASGADELDAAVERDKSDAEANDATAAQVESGNETADGPTADSDEGTSAEEATATGEGTEDQDTSDDETAETESATVDCPDCGTDLAPDANFCLECGADVQDLDSGEPEPLTECPECGADVEEDANFCMNCGEDLASHRDGESGGDESESQDAVEALAAQSDDGDEAEPVPDSLVLEVSDEEIPVVDGEKVGREIRAALIDAGRPEDEAVRIHREHVRFVREADAFYLVDLGDNPTRLNGRTLQKGDREPVAPGDELELSGVATVTIRAP
ncbi:zinc ribbon domain-containing protein [Haloarcula amylovorans]|uniref:zinc ribbon domain-containing protein n=1 Tax=Haloarcula amylovorans TaxID=2562280 RepID=UPI0010761A8A|nr:zinc ribbon domain-containing protein [Halomicroarcula amylolytica]